MAYDGTVSESVVLRTGNDPQYLPLRNTLDLPMDV